MLRRKLHLGTQRTKAGYAVPPEELGKLERLYGRYGLNVDDEPAPRSGAGEHGEHGELPQGDDGSAIL